MTINLNGIITMAMAQRSREELRRVSSAACLVARSWARTTVRATSIRRQCRVAGMKIDRSRTLTTAAGTTRVFEPASKISSRAGALGTGVTTSCSHTSIARFRDAPKDSATKKQPKASVGKAPRNLVTSTAPREDVATCNEHIRGWFPFCGRNAKALLRIGALAVLIGIGAGIGGMSLALILLLVQQMQGSDGLRSRVPMRASFQSFVSTARISEASAVEAGMRTGLSISMNCRMLA